jgi:hypothetical protein
MFPHTMETGIVGGPGTQRVVLAKIEVNVPIDNARFRMPSRSSAPAD